MKVLLLIGLLLVPQVHAISKEKQKELDYELQFQKEGDDLKVKIAALTAAVIIMMLYVRGNGDDAKEFDEMIRDILKK